MRLILLPAALLIAAAPGSAQHRHHEEVPAATPVGTPVHCIPMSQVRETRVRSDRVIDFVMSGRKVYRNTLPQECPGLGFEKRFLHKTTLNEYCSVDTITVLHTPPSMPGATCGLGEFQQVQLAPGTH